MGCLSDQIGLRLGFVHFCVLVHRFGVHFEFLTQNWSVLFLVSFVECDSIFRSFMGFFSDQRGLGLGFVHFCDLADRSGVHSEFF